jgi:hypothetical protein
VSIYIDSQKILIKEFSISLQAMFRNRLLESKQNDLIVLLEASAAINEESVMKDNYTIIGIKKYLKFKQRVMAIIQHESKGKMKQNEA